MGKMRSLASYNLQSIGDNISVTQHDALWMASCSRRVHQECEILFGINLGSAIACCSTGVAYACEVLELHLGVFLVADQDNTIFW